MLNKKTFPTEGFFYGKDRDMAVPDADGGYGLKC